jgi:hypothetical protein
MNLSNEAIIHLRPPTSTGLPTPTFNTPPKLTFLTNTRGWPIVFSTFAKHNSQPARRRILSIAPSGSYTISDDPVQTNGKALDLHEGTASRFEECDTEKKWEVLAWGKQGQLESWMVDEDDGWIGDGSGERRADWRNFYVVVYYEGCEGQESGIEVWDSFGGSRRLTNSTFERIKEAIAKVGDEKFAALAERLVELVPVTKA